MKRALLLFLLLFSFQLNAKEQKFRLAAESEPLLNVADCVNVRTGEFFQANQDIVVDGPVPLTYSRCYDRGAFGVNFKLYNYYGYGVGLGYPLTMQYQRFRDAKMIYIDQRHRFGIPFKCRTINGVLTGRINPGIFYSGYTNCTEALLNGQPSLVNAVAECIQGRWHVKLDDGTVRVYKYHDTEFMREQDACRDHYLLIREDHPNGLSTHFSYDHCKRLSEIALKNSQDQEKLTSVSIQYHGGVFPTVYTVLGSNKRCVDYRLEKPEGSLKSIFTGFSPKITGTVKPT